MGTLLFISGQEIFIILLVVLLLFGADKLPEIAKGIGKGMRDFRKATEDIRKEIEESTREVRNEISDIQTSVENEMNDISDSSQRK
jgi:sec-independent protein translocase protein TatA